MANEENKVEGTPTPAPNTGGDLSAAPVVGANFVPTPDNSLKPAAAPAAPSAVPAQTPAPSQPPAQSVVTPTPPPAAAPVVQTPVSQPPPPPVAPVNAPPPTPPTPTPATPTVAPTPTPTAPPTPPPAKTPPASASAHIDLSKVVLPQKNAQSVASAQRVNAAEVLKSEATPMQHSAPEAPKVAPPPKPETEESVVKPLQTFRGDIEKVVEGKQVSVVSIAAAEAERRGRPTPVQGTDPAAATAPAQAAPETSRQPWLTPVLVIGGFMLLSISAGALAYVLTRPTSVAIPKEPTSPFIAVDNTHVVAISDGSAPLTRANTMAALQSAREQTSLSLGLVGRLWPVVGVGTNAQELPAENFLAALSSNTPTALLRTLEPTFLLGIHSFDENQPFLLLRTDSYEVAYGSMLEWERTLQQDLAPLFTRTPRPRIPEEETLPLDPVASSTAPTSTPVATSTPTTPQTPLVREFTDAILENRDTRVLYNDTKDPLLLWTFLDRNTIFITTNEYTLREVITRIQNAPVVPIGAQ